MFWCWLSFGFIYVFCTRIISVEQIIKMNNYKRDEILNVKKLIQLTSELCFLFAF